MTFQSFQERFFQAGLLLLVFLSGFLFTSAEETDGTEDLTQEDYACAIALIEGSEVVLTDYFTFLDEYMQVDVPSSQQLESATMYYRYVEDTLNNLYTDNAKIEGADKSFAFADEELAVCRQKRDEYILLARTALYKQVLGSSTYKTTFKFVDGLKVMNENLANLSSLFQETFPGQFMQMDNGLKCYTTQCVSQ